jgi:hypothetical protein
MNLVRLLNLRFLNELAATNDRNLKFAALRRVSLELTRDDRCCPFFRLILRACEPIAVLEAEAVGEVDGP